MDAIYSISTEMGCWFDVVENLRATLGWEPRYIIGQPKSRDEIERRFPDAIYHARTRGFKSLPPVECPDDIKTEYPLDRELLDEIASERHIALQMMDRQDPGNVTGDRFSFRDRRQQLYRSLMYWQSVLDYVDPDVTVFTVSPHLLGEYVLYMLADRAGIETLVYKQTRLPDHFYVTGGLEEPPAMPDDVSTYDSTVSQENERYLADLRGKETVDRSGEVMGRGYDYGEIYRTYVSKLLSVVDLPRVISAIKKEHEFEDQSYVFSDHKAFMAERGKPPRESSVSAPQWLLYRLKAKYYRRKLHEYYREQAVEPDLERKYVYFPLHYQPERTTCPDANVYTDQYLIANLVSEHLPDGWHIYAKEHPAQWGDNRIGEMGRTRRDYDDLLSLGSVSLVRQAESAYAFIDSAEAVVTATGTSGWEAVVRGTPAVVFGPHAWYRKCPGVFYVQRSDEVAAVLAAVKDGVDVTEAKVNCYVNALEDIGYTGQLAKLNDTVSYDTNVENLTRAITERRQS